MLVWQILKSFLHSLLWPLHPLPPAHTRYYAVDGGPNNGTTTQPASDSLIRQVEGSSLVHTVQRFQNVSVGGV
eukprot:scaffold97237_cov23-Tisochrysis_lutea.AAC.1